MPTVGEIEDKIKEDVRTIQSVCKQILDDLNDEDRIRGNFMQAWANAITVRAKQIHDAAGPFTK